MKLRTRFALFSMVLVTIIVVGTSYSTLYFLKALVMQEIETTQRTLIENLAKVCEESQITRDDILAYNYLRSLQKTVRAIAYALFIHTERQLILGDDSVLIQALGPSQDLFEKAKENKRVESFFLPDGRTVVNYAAPVVLAEHRVGTAFLGFYEDEVDENIQESVQQIKTIIFYVAISAFFIGIIIALIFALRLTRPIIQLTAGAQFIGEGHLETQIDIKRKDEIGVLAKEFNLMAIKLKELDELKDAFVSSVSHELRSPLTAISGYVELLTMKPINQIAPEKVSKALNIMQESTTRLTQFVNDILDAAKIKAGKMELHKTHFDVKVTSQSLFDLFQPLFDKKKIEAVLDVGANIPEVAADIEKVRQVMTNLLSNAYKFTPEGGKIILLARGPEEGKEWVTIGVKDTGIGIPKEHQHLIFGRFQQVPGAKDTIKGPKGTGLGLVIAKGIVEAHGGTIHFESEVGHGTFFYFTLPLKAEVGQETVQAKTLA
jgi:signal transduction histidine kinase